MSGLKTFELPAAAADVCSAVAAAEVSGAGAGTAEAGGSFAFGEAHLECRQPVLVLLAQCFEVGLQLVDFLSQCLIGGLGE
jgi:hypothetical protein